ncbi:MAG: hypothetical protein QOI42_2185 [Frankiaceae bacterium]|nr:hypothetical protein [Frankiaceae bacterium]
MTHAPPRPAGDQRGMVTAELAVAVAAVAVLLSVSAGALSAGLAQLRCVDAARAAARVGARGESPEAVRAAALARSPRGAVVTLTRDQSSGDHTVTVVVAASVHVAGPLPALTVSATAVAAAEGLE